MHLKIYLALAILGVWLPLPADAREQSPVWIVDELVAEPGRTKFEFGMRYVNFSSNGAVGLTGGYLELMPSVYVPFITHIEHRSTQIDRVVGTLGVRRGITNQTEVSLRTNGAWTSTRSSGGLSGNESTFSFDGVSGGFTHRLAQTSSSSLILFGNVGLINRYSPLGRSTSSHYFENAAVGISGYTVRDPVIFSLSASSSFRRSIRLQNGRYRGGSMMTISPVLSFIANPSITISAGLNISYKEPDRYRSKNLKKAQTNMKTMFSVGYQLNKKMPCILTIRPTCPAILETTAWVFY